MVLQAVSKLQLANASNVVICRYFILLLTPETGLIGPVSEKRRFMPD